MSFTKFNTVEQMILNATTHLPPRRRGFVGAT
jgi:hypothetical protein